MQDRPRLSKISDVFDLAIYMSSKPSGITIEDIMERYNISRRTAERRRDALMNVCPHIDEIDAPDNKKHWGFTNYSICQLINFEPKEIANIEQLQRRTTNKELKEELGKTIEKIKSFNQKNLMSIENKIEMIMQTEGYAVRQMPQYKINLEVLEVVRDAVRSSKMVEGTYHGKRRLIEPLGMIYGEKIYLIAWEKAKGDEIYNYLLHKFEDLNLLDKTFDREGFNLQEYTNLSFGVYHGDILDVKLLFSEDLAEEASRFNFHPTQKIKWNNDGTLLVNFKASGEKEIIRHVFKWGKGCKILSPKKLNEKYKKYLKECLDNQ